MNTYAIVRHGGWRNPDEVARAAERSSRVGREEMADRIRWVRSYIVEEPDATLGSICIYQASDEQAIREHAKRADLPANEIAPVRDTVVIEPDPRP